MAVRNDDGKKGEKAGIERNPAAGGKKDPATDGTMGKDLGQLEIIMPRAVVEAIREKIVRGGYEGNTGQVKLALEINEEMGAGINLGQLFSVGSDLAKSEGVELGWKQIDLPFAEAERRLKGDRTLGNHAEGSKIVIKGDVGDNNGSQK
jgi:hypothetical protein